MKSLRSSHAFKKVILQIVCVIYCLLALPPALTAQEKQYKLTAFDRNRIQVNGSQWLDLVGIDMSHPTSKRKSNLAFQDEINRFLKTLIGKEIFIEQDETLPPARKEKTVYAYYLLKAENVNMADSANVGAKPVLMINGIRNEKGKLQANMTPHLQIMINMELLQKGYARVDNVLEFKQKKQFLLAEREAQIEKRGIWG
jgi:hypothetical protein